MTIKQISTRDFATSLQDRLAARQATAEADHAARFTGGPEGSKEWKAWFAKQPKEFQDEWKAKNEEYGDKFKGKSASRPYKTYQGDPRWMRARREGVADDGSPVKRGQEILYWPSTKTVMVGRQAKEAWAQFQSEAADEFVMGGSRWAANESDTEGMFEKNKPADPCKNMSDAECKEWDAQNKAHRDEFTASSSDSSESDAHARYEEGDMSPAEKKKWEKENPELAENVKNPPPSVQKLKEKLEKKAGGAGSDEEKAEGAEQRAEADEEKAQAERHESEADREDAASKEAGKVKGPGEPDGTGPNPDCPKKKEQKEAGIYARERMTWGRSAADIQAMMDTREAAGPQGAAQVAIMQYLDDAGKYQRGGVSLTDMSSHRLFRGMHFKAIMKAAEVLAKKKLIKLWSDPREGYKLEKLRRPGELDPSKAIMYFDISFEDYNVEEDAEDPDSPNYELATELLADPQKGLRLEGDAMKEVGKMFGVRMSNEGHDNFGNLVMKFSVDSWEDVNRVNDIIGKNMGGGDDSIYLDVPYYAAQGFHLYPEGVNGPVYGVAAGSVDGDLEDWLDEFAPTGKHASTKKEAKGPGGLYGYTKKVQADCEACSRKLSRKVGGIARAAWNKDDRVAGFLQTHAKRGKSASAKLLLAALKDIGPKVASAGDKTASGAVNARYLASLPAPKKATILKAVAKHYGVSVREIEGELTDRDAEELYEYLAFDNRLAMQVYRDFQDGRFASAGGKTARVKSKLDSMGMIRDLEKKHGKGSKAYYEAVIKEVKAGVIAPAAVVGGGYKDGKKVAIKWLEDQMKSAKTASEKEATEYGMYGSPAKVARLGLTACAGVKEAAGELAADLHRRRSAAHSLYTGFLGEHAKTGKCKYSRMLLSYYPDESMKVASLPAPSSVDDWLAWND